MANTFFTPEDLRNLQNEASEKYQFIRLTVADIQGRSLSKQIATKHVTGALTGNVPFAAGSNIYFYVRNMFAVFTDIPGRSYFFVILQAVIKNLHFQGLSYACLGKKL